MKQFRDTPYYVTENGLIRDGKLLCKWITNKGYYAVGMYLEGKSHKFNLHRLIAEHYIPNPNNKSQVNHINGNKLDNRIENLEWVTNQENRNHAVENGLIAKGEKIGTSKFKKQDIKFIRENYGKFSYSELAKMFSTNSARIWKIVNYKTWKHI